MALRKTLGSLRSAVRARVDEATAAFWTNAILNLYINDARNRCWGEVRKLKDDYFDVQRTSLDGTVYILDTAYACTGFQIVAGTREYTLPPDFHELRLIECITSGHEALRFVFRRLAHPDMIAARAQTQNLTPASEMYYALIGERTLSIAPATDTTLDLRLTYVPIISDLGGAHPITSLTRSSTTATATTGAPHGLTTGDEVTVAGATAAAYNVTAAITVTGASTFTYTVAGSPTTPDPSTTITYTSDGDTLQMPHALYDAVVSYATALALAMDRSPEAAVWEQAGNQRVALALGSAGRQSQDAEYVRGYLEDC